jgi:hypothetical protein
LPDVARAHALEVHLGARRQQRPLAPLPAGKQARVIWLAPAYLRNRKLQFAHTRLERPRLAPVAVAATLFGPLVRTGVDMFGHLDRHRLMNHRFQEPLQPVLLGEQLLQRGDHPPDNLLSHRLSP